VLKKSSHDCNGCFRQWPGGPPLTAVRPESVAAATGRWIGQAAGGPLPGSGSWGFAAAKGDRLQHRPYQLSSAADSAGAACPWLIRAALPAAAGPVTRHARRRHSVTLARSWMTIGTDRF